VSVSGCRVPSSVMFELQRSGATTIALRSRHTIANGAKQTGGPSLGGSLGGAHALKSRATKAPGTNQGATSEKPDSYLAPPN